MEPPRAPAPEPQPGAPPRERHRGRLLLALALVLLVATVVANAVFGDRGILALVEAKRELQEFERKIAALREENRALLGEVRALKTDPLAIEKVAREELGLSKPDEIVLVLKPSDSTPGAR